MLIVNNLTVRTSEQLHVAPILSAGAIVPSALKFTEHPTPPTSVDNSSRAKADSPAVAVCFPRLRLTDHFPQLPPVTPACLVLILANVCLIIIISTTCHLVIGRSISCIYYTTSIHIYPYVLFSAEIARLCTA